MALTSWKSFNFFETTQVPLPNDEYGSVFNNNVSALTTGADNLFLGTGDGVVHILSSAFKVIRSFRAYDTGSIAHITHVKTTSLLLTVAEDLPNQPVLKVWELDKEDKKTGNPKCLTTLAVQNGHRQFPTSAFAMLPDVSQVAVGFANGSVTLIRGDLIHERGTRQTTIFESEEPVTGLSIRLHPSPTLFISTTNRIVTMSIVGKVQGQTPRTIENMGCAVGCMTYDEDTGDVFVAREDAIYTYRTHGRGPSFGFDAPKDEIKVFGNYVALICPPRSVDMHPALERLRGDELFNTTKFVILDPDLRFVAHTENLVEEARFTFVEWGDLFIVTTDGTVHRYHEKTLQQKLDILYQRNLYILAINMAQKAGVDKMQQNLIFRKYGDFLYQKGDYDTAMQQYLRAIDNTEPSQVIRKFLDTHHIQNLIEYLEELHYHSLATADHTTLLLNCYAKLKDTSKLDSFIKEPGEFNFDLETAIQMCRQGGYFEQAAYLAKRHGESALVVDILVEDSNKYEEALDYMWTLDVETMHDALKKYARVLLGNCPDKTTQLFIEYHIGKYKPKKEEGDIPVEEQAVPASPYTTPKPRSAFSSFVDQPKKFIEFLEAVIDEAELEQEDKTDVYTTLFEMYLDAAKGMKDATEKEAWEKKAKKLIEGKEIPMSTSNVLLLSDLSDFREGTTLVQEQEGLCGDIFRSYTSAKDTPGVIKALKKYGPRDPQLYIDALTYFTSSPQVLEEAGDELEMVLKKIDADHLLSPLQVVQALSSNNVVTIGRIKKYLSMHIEKERKEISNNRKLINNYAKETSQKRDEIAELSSKPTTFQSRRCSSCGGALDLPVVHFLCKHSFHKRCLNITFDANEEDLECPVCGPQNQTIKAIRKKQVESAGEHDVFKEQLARSTDRFGVVSDWFGRGVMRPGFSTD